MKSYLLPATSVFGQDDSSLPVSAPVIEHLFDHVPETAFFIKDSQGRYLAVNQSLVDRCGVEDKGALLGRHVFEIFPRELAELYWKQDQSVLRSGRAIVDHLELHWYAHRRPGWCLTTKLPMRSSGGEVIGLAGISRDLRAPGDADIIPARLASNLEYLESNYSDAVTPGSLARLSGLPSVRFARLIKRIFRLTPNQLIVQTRLAAAARLLVETNHSMADIACDCGFYDHSALTRAFRSATNMTPSRFRALSRVNQADLKKPEAARVSDAKQRLGALRPLKRS